MKIIQFSIALWVALFSFTVSAHASAAPVASLDQGSDQAQAKRTPWGGYWWSMLNAELALGWDDGEGRNLWSKKEILEFDQCLTDYSARCEKLIEKMSGPLGVRLSPLMKFDLWTRKKVEQLYPNGVPYAAYSHASKRELEIHYIGNDRNHRYWDSRGYSGKCIGWALTNFDYDEPTKDRVIDGILFKPADLKGILSTIYNGAQFFVPESKVYGTEYHDASDDSDVAYEDVLPHDFVRALHLTIKKGKMLEADLEPGDGVWNYPVYKYQLKWEKKNQTTLSAQVRIFYADDEVGIDEVFSTQKNRSDLISQDLTFELKIPQNWDGDLLKATGGRWTGESRDHHPDVVILGLEKNWRETVYEYRNTQMNQEVNYQLLKRVKGSHGKWTPIVDDLIQEYYR